MICHCKKLLWIVLLLCVASVASAEWYKDYEAALDLLKKGRTGEAIGRFQAAIAQKNQEGLNIKFYGMKFDDYLPHYYLGKAYFSQKNYAQAVREFEQSANQGEIQRNQGFFRNLTELQTLAKAQLNPAPQPVTPTPEPKKVIPEPQPTTTEPKKQEPEAKKQEVEPAVRQPEMKKEIVVEPKQTPEVPIQPPVSAEELNLQKTRSILKDGAKRYLQGDFDSAIASFSSALRLSPNEFSAQFLLGCSYAAKYLLSGSQDRSSYDKAMAAFQQSRRMNPNHPLTKNNLISPAVREIYEKTS